MIQQQQQDETLISSQPQRYFNHDDMNEKYAPIRNVLSKEETDFDSDMEVDQKRTSWCLDSNLSSDTEDEQFRQELIQRATTRLRRRRLEQSAQEVMSQVVSLQTQLETLRLDAATTIDAISDIFSFSDESATLEGTSKMNRQMDVLERRLEAHKSSLVQITAAAAAVATTKEEEQQQHMIKQPVKEQATSPLTALSMSRLSSLSLMSSIFGRSSCSTSSSAATSISDSCSIKYDELEDDDCISHIEHIQGQQQEEDNNHPFYDLAGKRSFRAGSFCGSVYHKEPPMMQQHSTNFGAVPNNYNRNNNDIRYRRRQRRQRHQQHLEQQQQQQYLSDNESVMSDDLSTFSSISSSISNLRCYNNNNNSYNEMFCHPLSSPVTPPSHINNFYFHHEQQDLTHSWISYNDLWATAETNILQKNNSLLCPAALQRNVLDDLMSFLDGSTGDDVGFKEDALFLLDRPDLCRRPLSEVQNTLKEHRLFLQHQLAAAEAEQQEYQQQHKSILTREYIMKFLNPATWCQLGLSFSTDIIYKTTCTSLEWCRFLSVLAAAVVISLLKGPEDIRRHSAPF
jgi:hypothetical protein